ncbi:MAG: site-specific DNA-methyltransferase, partial [Candidatus Altarchaeum sp. CG03_land_8_20_14_0_80_32_618]
MNEYPDAKLLKRERKVLEREKKERVRGGTKHLKETREIPGIDISDLLDRIICGDSEIILRDFPDNCIDIIITSPPYNFGLQYENDKSKDSMYWQDYFEKLNRIWKECCRILKPGGRLCINVQPLFSDYMPTHHIVSKQLLDLGLLWKAEIIW